MTLDHLDPMTRTVADAARMLQVMAGRDGLDPRQPADLQPQDLRVAHAFERLCGGFPRPPARQEVTAQA